jgi:hypothetical protein
MSPEGTTVQRAGGSGFHPSWETNRSRPHRVSFTSSRVAITTVHRQSGHTRRYWVIVFAVSLAVIQYIDRVCISQAAPLIRATCN